MRKPARPGKAPITELERVIAEARTAVYVLRLYLSGTSPHSQRALSNVRRICEKHLKNRYELQIIDVYQDSTRASADQVVAIPTLIKAAPAPLRRLVGDLSDEKRVLTGLGLTPEGARS